MKLLVLSVLASRVMAVWPVPQSYTHGNSTIWIGSNLNVTYNGQSIRWSPESSYSKYEYRFWVSRIGTILQTWRHLDNGHDKIYSHFSSHRIVEHAVKRALDIITEEDFVPWRLFPRNELSTFEPPTNCEKTYLNTLIINQYRKDSPSAYKPLAGQVDESYKLEVTVDGEATIFAVSYHGVLHALDTFTQLFYSHSQSAGIYSNLAPVSITDSPQFSHRGLNLDVSRNWYPKSDILRTIDALSWNKFNRLHIHMTDGQSWPMDIPALPELSQKAAYQRGLSYSPSDIAEIQTYGVYRGVEVYIEIDMPGHTSAIALAYPSLIAAFNQHPWEHYCAEPPCGTLKLNSSAVNEFVKKLLDDILPRILPYSAYFHTGGDEISVNAYMLDDTVKSNLTSVLKPLLQQFMDRNHAQIREAGLVPVVWEEMALDWGLKLGDDVVVQTWINEASVRKLTALGHKVIFGNYNFWYLDCGKGQWLNFAEGDSFNTYYPFNDYCSPVKNWKLVYSYDPTAGLTDAQKNLILGGEVHMWSEQTDSVNLDDMIWPRASAAGEILWSGRQDESGNNRSLLNAAQRLAEMRERLVLRGVRAGPVQMIFCTQHNPTECAL